VRRQLVADDAVVPFRVTRGAVDDMDEHARPLDVAEEGVAQARALAGALDQPRHVRDRRPARVVVAELHDPQVRLERRTDKPRSSAWRR
jgi:hypothetical protein